MFYSYSEIGFNGLLLFGAIVFIGIYGYTTLMDRSKNAVWIELFRGILGLSLIFFTGDWFGINAHITGGSYLVAMYFVITMLGSVYFTYIERESLTANAAL